MNISKSSFATYNHTLFQILYIKNYVKDCRRTALEIVTVIYVYNLYYSYSAFPIPHRVHLHANCKYKLLQQFRITFLNSEIKFLICNPLFF